MKLRFHGDCLIVPVKEIPKNIKKVESEILLAGEQTGHAHKIIDGENELFREENGQLYLKVKTPSTIDHEEHKPQTIEPGTYVIRQPREMDHVAGMTRKVID